MKIDVHRDNRAAEEHALLDELILRGDLDDVIPQLARDVHAIARIESVVRRRHTEHDLIPSDSLTSVTPRGTLFDAR